MFRKTSMLAIILSVAVSSCSVFGKLISTTSISAKNSFALGENEHNKFKAKVKNLSNQSLEFFLKPIGENATLVKMLVPNEISTVDVPKNTAVIIKNNSNELAEVYLKVTGDTGLSMSYKK